MARGGRRPGAGRPRGSADKFKKAALEGAAKLGLTPLQYMLAIMRSPTARPKRRDEMAKAAAPYVHPRLATTELKGENGGAVPVHLTVTFVDPPKGVKKRSS